MRLLSAFLLLVVVAAFVVEAKRHRHREDHKDKKNDKHVNAPALPKDAEKEKEVEKMLTKKAKHLSKKLWNKLKSDYKKTEELHEMAQCEELNCHNKKQICLIHVKTGKPECVSKRGLNQRKKHKSQYKKWKNTDWEVDDGSESAMDDKIQSMKKDAEKYIEKHGVMMKRRMQKMYQKEKKKDQKRSRKDKKIPKVTTLLPDTNSTTEESEAHQGWTLPVDVCSQKDLMKLGQDLLTLFKKQQDDANEVGVNDMHQIEKRNSKKKELREDDECICQASVSWQFIQLDVNTDGHIVLDEMVKVADEDECLAQFVASCDKDDDGSLSEKEWCCCFSEIAPPCLSALQVVLTDDYEDSFDSDSPRPKVMIGAQVPQCDDEGFFKTTQCHSSTGYCWCVDKFGNTIEETETQGEINCDKHELIPTEDNDA